MDKQNDIFTHLSILHMKIDEIKLYATICMSKQSKKSTYSSILISELKRKSILFKSDLLMRLPNSDRFCCCASVHEKCIKTLS